MAPRTHLRCAHSHTNTRTQTHAPANYRFDVCLFLWENSFSPLMNDSSIPRPSNKAPIMDLHLCKGGKNTQTHSPFNWLCLSPQPQLTLIGDVFCGAERFRRATSPGNEIDWRTFSSVQGESMPASLRGASPPEETRAAYYSTVCSLCSIMRSYENTKIVSRQQPRHAKPRKLQKSLSDAVGCYLLFLFM